MVAVKTTEGGRWILPQIQALRRRGAEVVVLLPAGPGRLASAVADLASSDPAVRLVRSPFDFCFRPRRGLVAELAGLRRLVAAAEVDTVLYHLYATALAIRLSTWGLRTRRVHMVAGPLYLESPLIAAVERVLWRWDSHIVCGSRYIFDRYRRLGVPAQRMSVVPYGVDTDRFRPGDAEERAQARQRLGLPAHGLVAVMVSYVYAPKRLVLRGRALKGHAVLLEAWGAFRARHPEATLLLVGSGFDEAGERHRQEIVRDLRARHGGEGVAWLDSVEDVQEVYRSADVSISPSLSDNHGAVLEASAMGLPSIVTDAGALPEAVPAGTGWIAGAGSATDLLHCLEACAGAAADGGLADRGARARRYVVAHFDQRASTEQVVDQLCGPAPAGVASRG
jgi:glycosyltransferase involved in cell wall biosynthesis